MPESLLSRGQCREFDMAGIATNVAVDIAVGPGESAGWMSPARLARHNLAVPLTWCLLPDSQRPLPLAARQMRVSPSIVTV